MEAVRCDRLDRRRCTVATVTLEEMPEIYRLTLATVTQVPEWHPERDTFQAFPVHAWVVHHPDGAILVDTGIGAGNPTIDAWFHPEVTDVGEALASAGLEVGDIDAIVLSHLHFDHCGQQRRLRAPVYVQADEHRLARQPLYTVAEWATVGDDRLRLVRGDVEMRAGVRLIATPGHTPGHQSVVVSSRADRVVLAAQCAYRASEVRSGEPGGTNLHDESWRSSARESLARIRSLRPSEVHLSHDREVVRSAEGCVHP